MIGNSQLSDVLSEFARTMLTGSPVQQILDHLVCRSVDVLPITAAGVTLVSDGCAPRHTAASDEFALRCEKRQTALGEGPCITAYASGDPVAVPDLVDDRRFPLFATAAREAGLAAVFSFPMRHTGGQLGALNLYRDTCGELGPQDMAAAQTLADVATAYLRNAQSRQQAQATTDRLRHNALHDPLTQLPNRTLLQQRLEHAAQRARRTHAQAAVLFADIDCFKHVNDCYGHLVGDALLVAVAERLLAQVRPGDTLARVSGDEFVILCEEIRSSADVEALAQRIDHAFAVPFTIVDREAGSIEVTLSASVGLAYAGGAEDIGPELIGLADKAMYQAKSRSSAAYHAVDPGEATCTDDRLQLQQDLRDAVTGETLQLSYQPIVQVADGHVTGVEALLRWTHCTRGPIPAVSLVAVAEQDSLILDVGAWVLQRSCEDHVRWKNQHPGHALALAVNVSGRQLLKPGFCDQVERALTSTGLDPSELTLEMTERVFFGNASRAVAVLRDLKEMGVRLALDDFGTGYSSLSYLRHFPVDIVKIDRSFVADIGPDSGGTAIVAAVTELAHVLGLDVTAEGVETEQQRDELQAIGCEYAQGYYYANPLTVGEATTWLQTGAGTCRIGAPAPVAL